MKSKKKNSVPPTTFEKVCDEIAKYMLDISKLIFGGIVLVQVLNFGIATVQLLVIGLIAAIICLIVGIIFLIVSNLKK